MHLLSSNFAKYNGLYVWFIHSDTLHIVIEASRCLRFIHTYAVIHTSCMQATMQGKHATSHYLLRAD